MNLAGLPARQLKATSKTATDRMIDFGVKTAANIIGQKIVNYTTKHPEKPVNNKYFDETMLQISHNQGMILKEILKLKNMMNPAIH